MLKIAIVGNIASGKSTVEEFLIQRDYNVLDCDKVCHNLLDCNDVYEAFKTYDVFENHKISRDKLGKLIFNNADLKKVLEACIYPNLIIEIQKFFNQNSKEELVFVSAPVLFEAGMENLFDKILFIYCDDDVRMERLLNRNGYSIEYAKVRMSSQQNQNDKVKKSDWVIYNNGSKDELYNQVSKLIEQIR